MAGYLHLPELRPHVHLGSWKSQLAVTRLHAPNGFSDFTGPIPLQKAYLIICTFGPAEVGGFGSAERLSILHRWGLGVWGLRRTPRLGADQLLSSHLGNGDVIERVSLYPARPGTEIPSSIVIC
jgi:hypothetical protein